MRLLQLLRALRHKDVRLFYVGLDRVHHGALFIDQGSQFFVDLVHTHNILLELSDTPLLLLQRLQINLFLHLGLLLVLLRHKVILERSIVVAAARVASAAWRWTCDGYTLVGMRPRLLQCVLLVVNRLALHGLECSQGGGELIHQAIPLYLVVAVLAVSNLVDQILRVIDQLLRISSYLMAVCN